MYPFCLLMRQLWQTTCKHLKLREIDFSDESIVIRVASVTIENKIKNKKQN